MSKSEYSQLSHSLTKSLTKKNKRENGIYFTPPSTIRILLQNVISKFLDKETIHVLEPSCGSGEFITALCESSIGNKLTIEAIEKNDTIFDSIRPLYEKESRVNLLKADFLPFFLQIFCFRTITPFFPESAHVPSHLWQILLRTSNKEHVLFPELNLQLCYLLTRLLTLL